MTQAASLKVAMLAGVSQGWGLSGLGVLCHSQAWSPSGSPLPSLEALFHPQPQVLDHSKCPGLARTTKTVCLWPEQASPDGLLASQVPTTLLCSRVGRGLPGMRSRAWLLAPARCLSHTLGLGAPIWKKKTRLSKPQRSPEAKTWEHRPEKGEGNPAILRVP